MILVSNFGGASWAFAGEFALGASTVVAFWMFINLWRGAALGVRSPIDDAARAARAKDLAHELRTQLGLIVLQLEGVPDVRARAAIRDAKALAEKIDAFARIDSVEGNR